MKELNQRTGTIAHVFTKHKDEIFALCMSPKTFNALKSCVDSLLNCEELSKNNAVKEARENLKNKNFSAYTSILMTYMTGSKVS